MIDKLIKATEKKKKYYEDRMGELHECLINPNITKDCKEYIREEIDRAMTNIVYYTQVLKVLKEVNNGKLI